MKTIASIIIVLLLFGVTQAFAQGDAYTHKSYELTWTNCTTTNCVPDVGLELAIMQANDTKDVLDAHAADGDEHIVTAIAVDDCSGFNVGITGHTYTVGSKLIASVSNECGITIGTNYYVCTVVGANDIEIDDDPRCLSKVFNSTDDLSVTTELARVEDTVSFPIRAKDAVGLPSLIDLISEMMGSYVLHNADQALATPLFHEAQGNDDALASEVVPTTLATAITRLTDLRTKMDLHDADTDGHVTGALHPVTAITDYPVPLQNAKSIDITCDTLTDTNHDATDWDWKVLTSNVNTGLTASFDAVSTPYWEEDPTTPLTVDIIQTWGILPSRNFWTMRIDENAALRFDGTCNIQWKE